MPKKIFSGTCEVIPCVTVFKLAHKILHERSAFRIKGFQLMGKSELFSISKPLSGLYAIHQSCNIFDYIHFVFADSQGNTWISCVCM